MDDNKHHYKIDPEFRDLIPPLSPTEYEELEKSILIEGCRESIYIWNDYIIDGHNRYEICLKHGLEPPVFTMSFNSREEVIVWICSVQLARRNVNETIRRYLIGKRYETEKLIGAHNANGCNQYTSQRKEVRYQSETEPPFDSSAVRTRDRLGKEYNLASATVFRYGEYSKAIDKLRKVSPTAAKKILNEKALINTKQLVSLNNQPDNELRKFCRRINESTDDVIPYSKTRSMITKYIGDQSEMQLPDNMGAIKEMPQYDPDAEIKSLSLTVPSWIRSIERVLTSLTTPKASLSARSKLSTELKSLKSITDKLLYKLEEEQTNE